MAKTQTQQTKTVYVVKDGHERIDRSVYWGTRKKAENAADILGHYMRDTDGCSVGPFTIVELTIREEEVRVYEGEGITMDELSARLAARLAKKSAK